MPARPRQSGSGQVIRRDELPEYEPLTFPLTANAQIDISSLHTRHSLKSLDKYLSDALTILQENAAGINDALHLSDEAVRQRRSELARVPSSSSSQGLATAAAATAAGGQQRAQHVEQLETELEANRVKVTDLTRRIEESVRKTIDAQQAAGFARDVLADLVRDIAARSEDDGSDGPTQTQTQRRTQHQLRGTQPATQSSSGMMPASFVPTEPGATQALEQQGSGSVVVAGPSTTFRTQLERRRDRYTSYDYRQRYAANNDYRQFRRLLHDAQHQDADVPMPHESTWFASGGRTAPPGVTRQRSRNIGDGGNGDAGVGPGDAVDDDDDEDLAVARETISTRCPLTLLDFTDPVTSVKCPHSFEREAIFGIIKASTLMVDGDGGSGRGRVKAVQCPVPGCSNTITAADLKQDLLLVRRIERLLQKKRRLEDEGDDDDDADDARGGKRRVVDIGSSEVEDNGEEEVVTGTSRRRLVKGEKRRAGSVEL